MSRSSSIRQHPWGLSVNPDARRQLLQSYQASATRVSLRYGSLSKSGEKFPCLGRSHVLLSWGRWWVLGLEMVTHQLYSHNVLGSQWLHGASDLHRTLRPERPWASSTVSKAQAAGLPAPGLWRRRANPLRSEKGRGWAVSSGRARQPGRHRWLPWPPGPGRAHLHAPPPPAA